MTDEFQKALADIPESWCDDFNHEGLPCFGTHLVTIRRALAFASAATGEVSEAMIDAAKECDDATDWIGEHRVIVSLEKTFKAMTAQILKEVGDGK